MNILRSMLPALTAAALVAMTGLADAGEKVRVAMSTSWPGYAPAWLAANKNLAPGIDFKFIIQEDPLTGYAMLASGQLDIYLSTIEYIPVAAEQGLPIVYVATTNPSFGVDQIVLPAGREIKDLRGGKIAAPEAYIGQLFAAFWLDQVGIGADEVTWINLTGDQVFGPTISGDLDATYTYEPWTSKLIDNMKGARVVADTDDPEIIKSGLFAEAVFMRRGFIEENREAAKLALKAHFDGVGYWHENTDESNQYFAELLGWPLADIEAVVGTNGKYAKGGIYMSSFDETAKICGALKGEHPLGIANGGVADTVELVKKYWRQLGLVKTDVDVSDYVDCSLLKELADSGYRQDFAAR